MAYHGPYHRAVGISYRKVLADNVAALMRANPALGSHAKLAKRCSTAKRKIGARTIGHLLNAEDGPQPQLDTIVAVADAFEVEPWMLLNPEFDAVTRSIAGARPEVLMIASRIADLPEERRLLLMEIFATEGEPTPTSPRSVHDSGPRRYESPRTPRSRK